MQIYCTSLTILLSLPSTSLQQFEEMNSELEENRELAENRLIELQKLQQDLQNVHQENNNMKVILFLRDYHAFRIMLPI